MGLDAWRRRRWPACWSWPVARSTRTAIHPENVFTRIGGHSGQLIEPKRCLLKVVILTRPFADPAINEVVWRVADEQVIPPAERRAWEVNGLRVGRIIGEFPLELEAILKETAPGKTVDPTNIFRGQRRTDLDPDQ